MTKAVTFVLLALGCAGTEGSSDAGVGYPDGAVRPDSPGGGRGNGNGGGGGREGEAEAEAEAEAEGEAEGEPFCKSEELCDDGLDNDCNGLADCDDPYCQAVIVTLSGAEDIVRGAPEFALDAASPSGAGTPSATQEVIRIIVKQVGCAPLAVRKMVFAVSFFDNAATGWNQGALTLVLPDGEMLTEGGAWDKETGLFFYEFSLIPADLQLGVGEEVLVTLTLDTSTIASGSGNTIQVALFGPVRFQVFGMMGGNHWMAVDPPVAGGVFVY